MRWKIIAGCLVLSSVLLSNSGVAQVSSPAPNTTIENQAVGSFLDSTDNSTQVVESNVVTVTIAEVAGITVTVETPLTAASAGELAIFEYVITNVGNDPTQFFLPSTYASILTNGSPGGGSQEGDLTIVEYDADGASGSTSPVALNIAVPTAAATGDLTGFPNGGAIPAGGTVTVRLPIRLSQSLVADDVVSVDFGETSVVDGQNEPLVVDSQDVYTQDNLGTNNGDFNGSPINGEREASARQSVTIIGPPEVLLVKRVTAINEQRSANPNDGTPLNQFVDDTSSSNADDDNHPNWPVGYLVGAIDGGAVRPISEQPADTVEYTIYFLSVGDVTAQGVQICDRIPANTTFLPDAYRDDLSPDPSSTQSNSLGIALDFNGSEQALTGASDGDVGYYLPPNVDPSLQFPDISCDGPNNNGTIVIQLGDLPQSTGAGTPTTAYGAIRFQVGVN